MELLPEPKELWYSVTGDDGDKSVGFVEAHKNAGYPVTLIRDATPSFEAFRWAFDVSNLNWSSSHITSF